MKKRNKKLGKRLKWNLIREDIVIIKSEEIKRKGLMEEDLKEKEVKHLKVEEVKDLRDLIWMKNQKEVKDQ